MKVRMIRVPVLRLKAVHAIVLIALALMAGGCAQGKSAKSLARDGLRYKPTSRPFTMARLAGTYKCEACPGRDRWVLELHEDDSFEFFHAACVGRLPLARGSFSQRGDRLQLSPTEELHGTFPWLRYHIREEEGAFF